MKLSTQTTINVLRWIFGLLAIPVSFSSFNDSFPSGLSMLLFAFLVLPPLERIIFQKLKLNIPNSIKVIIGFVLFFLYGSFLPASTVNESNSISNGTIDKEQVPETTSTNPPNYSEQDNWFENKERTRVIRVIDGDTVEIEGGQRVRYIGIDSPEATSTANQECFGNEATEANKSLVEGKEVYLEKDVSETDRFGRLLRYVYVMSEESIVEENGAIENSMIFVNKYLVDRGYATTASFPPDIKFQDDFRKLEASARERMQGMWEEGVCDIPEDETPQNNSPTTQTPQAPSAPTPPTSSSPSQHFTAPTNPSSSGYTCDCSKTCDEMSCNEAQYQLNVCGCTRRDADKDGLACDSQCS